MTNYNKNTVSSKAAKALITNHAKLIHSENMQVTSHVQRESDEWIINTLMLDKVSVPFKYKRKQQYKSLQGQKVNLTYYSDMETVAGFDIEVMSVVRIKIS